MFWPDISPSLREAKSPVCHCEPAEGRRSNLKVAMRFIAHCMKQTPQSQSRYGKFAYPKEKYIWAQFRILHETEKAILIDNGIKI